ncbi:hypothetical protein V1522DRAFT_412856 [Lipomyces starkeyi]|jgi:hypothetical protein
MCLNACSGAIYAAVFICLLQRVAIILPMQAALTKAIGGTKIRAVLGPSPISESGLLSAVRLIDPRLHVRESR